MARLFFALWPDASVRQALLQAAASVVPPDAPAARAENLHLTLGFLGSVAAGRVREVLEVAGSLRTSAFSLTLDRLEHWVAARILCLTPGRVPPTLTQLAGDLRVALRARDLPADERPYRPHVTLCRGARAAAGQPLSTPLAGIGWEAREFVLAESADDAGRSDYRIIAQWPLSSAGVRRL